MWYSELINKNDGIKPLLTLFKTEKEFINYYFSNILFFKQKEVESQYNKLLKKIENNEKIPVRYTSKSKENFHFPNENNQSNIGTKKFKNKKEAKIFSSENELYHTESNIKIEIDNDGNYYVRAEIEDYTGYKVSQGKLSDYMNYTISHIWGNTSNPYFFTSFWNLALIPQVFSFILDKSKTNSRLVKKIKIITEIIHIELYELDKLLDKEIFTEENNFESDYTNFSEEYSIAKYLIDKNLINFLNSKSNKETHINIDVFDITNKLKSDIKNKEFIFTFLDKLKEIDFKHFDTFTNKERTKNICGLSYPILVNVTGATDEIITEKSRPVNSDVYYKQPFFEWKNNKYIVCNDWKKRHRKMLISWLNDRN